MEKQENFRKVKRLGGTVADSLKWHVATVVGNGGLWPYGLGGGESSGGGNCGVDLRRKGVKKRSRREYHILNRSGSQGKIP